LQNGQVLFRGKRVFAILMRALVVGQTGR
jgi:hypothetical protein